MAIPYTGLFTAASCNLRSSHGQYTRSSTEQLQSGAVTSARLLGQNYRNRNHNMVRDYVYIYISSFNPNHGDPAPLKPLGINHVHRPTHAPTAAASVNQGVYIASGPRGGCALRGLSTGANGLRVLARGGVGHTAPICASNFHVCPQIGTPPTSGAPGDLGKTPKSASFCYENEET